LEQGMKPADAAAAAGFGSGSSFHEQFSARTGLTPAEYAALRAASEFTLRLPADYRSREILDFFGRDKESVSERVRENGFTKCFETSGRTIGRVIAVDVEFRDGAAVCKTDAGA